MLARRKNVLLIVVDQWRGDILPKLGTPVLKTPNLDRLCAEGVTFRNHFTQGAPCGPARASLLTGLYQMNHRAVQNSVPLDARHRNLAHYLRVLGYDPALVGYTTTTPDPRHTDPGDPRFHVLGDIMDGFRPVGSFEPAKDPYFAWLTEKGYRVPEDRADIWLPVEGEPGPTRHASRIPRELSDTAWFTERGLTYIAGRGERPWFLHLGYWRPHPPFIAPAPYNAMCDAADMKLPERSAAGDDDAHQHPLLRYYRATLRKDHFFHKAPGLAADMSEAELRQMRATYYGLLTEIDDHLGRVFQHLRDTGQWDDTLIVFTCDHGEQLGDHRLLGKIGYFDGSFRIPMIVRDPSHEANGTRGQIVDEFTETIDCLPTILDWLGADVPRVCDGRSLLPFCRGPDPEGWRDAAHYEFDFRDTDSSQAENTLGVPMDRCGLAVIQDAAGKYVHFAGLPSLFFDLADDLGQFVNRADDPTYAARVRDYAARMLDWRLGFSERTLTHYRASPNGLVVRG